MSLYKEFKEFALRGSVVDLAIGVIIGAAFGKVVSSLVSDVVMPPLGALLGGVDFSDLSFEVKHGVLVKYGVFLNTVIDFLIVAAAIFLVIKLMNSLRKKENPTPTTKMCPECCQMIPIKAKKCSFCCSELKKEDEHPI
jgi:large conductance mechanosensitive channel